MKLFRLILLLAVSIQLFPAATSLHAAARKKTTAKCAKYLTETNVTDHSVPNGLIRHGEHMVDLILTQAGSPAKSHFDAFQNIIESLIDSVRAQTIDQVNEKIDGSPSIVLGFMAENNAPFVAYKGEFSGKRQRLVTSLQDAQDGFKGPLAQLYGDAITHFGATMGKMDAAEFKDYVFQGDLLFSTDGARIARTQDEIAISANSVTYKIASGSEYFERLSHAKIGVVIHTIGKRVVDQDGRVSVAPATADDRVKLKRFVESLNSKAVFAIHPWRENVEISKENQLSKDGERKIRSMLRNIEKSIDKLTPEFKQAWASRHERRFRVFFNSFLKPPSDGGFYLEASRQEPFDLERTLSQFEAWLAPRLEKGTDLPSYKKQAEDLFANNRAELGAVIESYYDAIRIQYLLAPHLKEIFRSKLGGGEVEGVMLETPGTIVKLIDRLDFTMRNNQRWDRSRPAAAAETAPGQFALPEPFNSWKPGAAFVIMKGQPVHSGHLKMIKQAVEKNSGEEVAVVISDKVPNLEAKTWKELKVSSTKKELLARDYTYVFDQDLRRDLLEAGLGRKAKVYFLNPSILWSYLATAKAAGSSGKVKLVVGEKEMEENRYDEQLQKFGDQLEPLAIDMQNDGISGTMVRQALKQYAIGNRTEKAAAKKTLEAALSEIPKKTVRARLLKRMVERWKLVDVVVQKLL